MVEIKPITDLEIWDAFVESSPQGTIFSTIRWLNLYDVPYQLWGVYKNGNLIGGSANFDELQPITPFQGVLASPVDMKYSRLLSLHNEVAESLLDVLPDQVCNHYTFTDIRPFQWAGWGIKVKYTYVLKPDWDELDKDTRYEINHAGIEVNRSDDIEMFDALYDYTFSHKGLRRTASTELIKKLFRELDAELYIASDNTAGVILIHDSKRYYYILGASTGSATTSKVLWEAVRDKNEVDLVGCNDRNIAHYKKGFGGRLYPYYGAVRL